MDKVYVVITEVLSGPDWVFHSMRVYASMDGALASVEQRAEDSGVISFEQETGYDLWYMDTEYDYYRIHIREEPIL